MLIDRHKFLKLPVILGMQQSWLHIPPVSASWHLDLPVQPHCTAGMWDSHTVCTGGRTALLQFARLEDVISCALKEQGLFPKTFNQLSKGPTVDGTCTFGPYPLVLTHG